MLDYLIQFSLGEYSYEHVVQADTLEEAWQRGIEVSDYYGNLFSTPSQVERVLEQQWRKVNVIN